MAKYANIIVDISIEKLDKTFQYRIPPELESRIAEGMQVDIPFGKRTMTGYVIELTDVPEYDPQKIRPVIGIHEKGMAIESQLIALAAWMRRNYGSTMNQALKTVLPVRKKMKPVEKKTVVLSLDPKEAGQKLALLENRHACAQARLLRELIREGSLDYSLVTEELGVSAQTIKAMETRKILTVLRTTDYRNPIPQEKMRKTGSYDLNEEQRQTAEAILSDWNRGNYGTYLLKGVTGSGKTEVYMELIDAVLKKGRQAIVLIPEIALTYQNVMRFYNRFGSRVAIINSRLSQGERYDQFQRAEKGDADIMIGPRSALFTPFPDLGLIIIDEEHESSYKSETVPRYHARETAIERARLCGASVVLGSATPSVYSYYQATRGSFRLLELKNRANNRPLPACEVVDMREELKKGNRSILSRRLQEEIKRRLEKGKQTMLFLNRRGISGIFSCRACGYVVKCPHCDVSMSEHRGKMVCHYCGYEEPVPVTCPSCGSKYISGFKAGTEKIEEIVQQRFPEARILRMDYDTTREKTSMEQILRTFADGEADILIGTQMIVKGHDFPAVTLVAALAADLSLHMNDFHAAERTFQLLTQAAGRAGRGEDAGMMMIQTYDPEHYAIRTAQSQSYEEFYNQEIAYRRLLYYPPVWNLLVIFCTSPDEEALERAVGMMAERLKRLITNREERARQALHMTDSTHPLPSGKRLQMTGPVDATIARINDVYRKVIYLKTMDYQLLVACKDRMESFTKDNPAWKEVSVQYDFNPVTGF